MSESEVSHLEEPQVKSQRIASLVRPEQVSRDGWQITDTYPPYGPPLHKFAMTLAVFVPLIGVVVAVIVAWIHGWMGWLNFNMLIGGIVLTGTGVTIGYHRMLAHKAFETYGWMRAYWMIMGALAVQKSPVEWCAVHRRHHQLSDRPGDPHSPHLSGAGFWNALKGFLYSHSGWLFTGYLLYSDHRRYVPDLVQDRTAVWIHRYYEVFWIPFSFFLPAVIGGLATWTWTGFWLGFLWGGLVRIFVVHHITWSINSICHIFGTQDYDVSDHSKNNFFFGCLAFGEGWHNNHHAFPSSARQGLKWWQFDSSWLIIRTMQLLGLVWNVKLPNAGAIAHKTLS